MWTLHSGNYPLGLGRTPVRYGDRWVAMSGDGYVVSHPTEQNVPEPTKPAEASGSQPSAPDKKSGSDKKVGFAYQDKLGPATTPATAPDPSQPIQSFPPNPQAYAPITAPIAPVGGTNVTVSVPTAQDPTPYLVAGGLGLAALAWYAFKKGIL